MVILNYAKQSPKGTHYLDIQDPKKIEFERVFDLMQWVDNELETNCPFFLILGEKSNTCRTYIAENKKQIAQCIRYWPSQSSYAIFEYDNITDCHLVAKDYREQCGFKTAIAQELK